jgi:ferredoxin
MTTALIIGSGAAAAGAALALSHRENLKISVIDIGLQLEADREQLVEALASSPPDAWDEHAIELVSRQPVSSRNSGVPEKRVFGSDYPFRDVGQLGGLTAAGDANASLISPAYGGFSNVWGSQIMPFTTAAFESWPVNADAMRCHYEAILHQIPFAGEEDDLVARFPLMRQPAPLPTMSPRSLNVLKAYENHKSRLNDRGITIGKARLAFEPEKCIRCGMCMTGCPYGLIYSAAQTFDALRRAGRVTFHSGFLALKVIEEDNQVTVITREIATGRTQRFGADRVYVACGAVGTTRLVANSLGLFDVDLPMLESRQFILPLLSLRATEDPRNKRDFTLNQFNVIVAPDGGSVDISMLHFYTFNPAFIDGLPSVLHARSAEWLQVQLLRRLTVAFGYLPSWNSSRLRIHIGSQSNHPELPDLQISSEAPPPGQRQMLRAVLLRLTQSARMLDLYPLIPMVRLSAPGKSYHWGGSFPHTADGLITYSSDRLGRVGPWKRTHLVDASVFPTVPAMTFGLTVMANAHRIASESLELLCADKRRSPLYQEPAAT